MKEGCAILVTNDTTLLSPIREQACLYYDLPLWLWEIHWIIRFAEKQAGTVSSKKVSASSFHCASPMEMTWMFFLLYVVNEFLPNTEFLSNTEWLPSEKN